VPRDEVPGYGAYESAHDHLEGHEVRLDDAFATVLATLVEIRAPRRFSPAAIITATRGERARVDTEVAIALAVSWKPLV